MWAGGGGAAGHTQQAAGGLGERMGGRLRWECREARWECFGLRVEGWRSMDTGRWETVGGLLAALDKLVGLWSGGWAGWQAVEVQGSGGVRRLGVGRWGFMGVGMWGEQLHGAAGTLDELQVGWRAGDGGIAWCERSGVGRQGSASTCTWVTMEGRGQGQAASMRPAVHARLPRH